MTSHLSKTLMNLPTSPFVKHPDLGYDVWGEQEHRQAFIPTPKLLFEGTHLTGKTDLCFKLAEHPSIIGHRRHRWHLPILTAEMQTNSDGHRPTKGRPGSNMIDYPVALHDWASEAFDNSVRMIELHPDHYWMIDRFHISCMSYRHMYLDLVEDLSDIDQRLAKLGFIIVFCKRKISDFAAAREERLEFSENPENYADLSRFVKEQEIMEHLVNGSAIPSISVEIGVGQIDEAAEHVIQELNQRKLLAGSREE